MSTRNLLNLTLTGLAVLLGLVIFFRPGLEAPPAPPAITAIPAADISSIQISRLTRAALSFNKTADQWTLTGEHNLPADDLQVRSLLSILGARTTRTYPADTLDLATLGLAPPHATLQLDDTIIYIGNTEPLDNNRYVQLGETIYLLTDRYQHLINAGWTNFVARKLMPPGASLSELQLPGITLTLAPDQQWQMLPDKPAVSADTLQGFIENWQRASATYIRRLTGSTTAETITLIFSDGTETMTLHVISRSPEFILARPDWGIQYHFSGSMEKALLSLEQPGQEPEAKINFLRTESNTLRQE